MFLAKWKLKPKFKVSSCIFSSKLLWKGYVYPKFVIITPKIFLMLPMLRR
jgi:hypothetical protein